MKININNMWVMTGEVACDPVVCDNADGSKRAYLVINPENGNDPVKFTGYINKEFTARAKKMHKSGLGPYEYLHEGERVQILYSVRSRLTQDHRWLVTPQIDYIQFASVIGTEKDRIAKIICENCGDELGIQTTEKKETHDSAKGWLAKKADVVMSGDVADAMAAAFDLEL